MKPISLKADYKGKFPDKRLDKRAAQIATMLTLGRTSSIHAISHSEADQRACYRFLGNENVEEDTLIEAETQRCQAVVGVRDVIIIQDTTLFDFSSHKTSLADTSGIGPVGNHGGIGFMGHLSLVLDGNEGVLLGLSDIQLWHREGEVAGRNNKAYKKVPIADKESGKWLKACETSKQLLKQATSLIFVEDREGDIYEQFATIPDRRTHLIIRSRENRRLKNGEKLHEAISKKAIAGSYNIRIVKDLRKKTETRTAKLDIRFGEVEISRPNYMHYKHLAEHLKVYVVDARETGGSITKPIRWTILTTKSVENYEDALEIIEKYKQRWFIEQLFRLLKQRGFRIEESQLENGWAIRKLTVMIMNAAVRVLQMLLAYGSEKEQDINIVFTKEEQQCLAAVNKKMETTVLINPYKKETVKYAVWIIARLAGWKDNNKARPPGPITLKRGIDKFTSIFEGWQMAKDVS